MRGLVPITNVETRPQEWLWPGRIPSGALTMLDGDPGLGKTALLTDLVARLTTGRAMPCCECDPLAARGAVLLLAEDDLAATVRPRLSAAGADLERIRVLDQDRFASAPFQLPDDFALLESAVDSVEAGLVVFDPLTSFVGGRALRNGGVRAALAPLKRLAKSPRVAVVLVRHLVKSRSRSAILAGAGSVDVIGLARSGLLVAPDPTVRDEFGRVLAQSKSNLAKAMAVRFRTTLAACGSVVVEWGDECDLRADDLLAQRPRTQPRLTRPGSCSSRCWRRARSRQRRF